MGGRKYKDGDRVQLREDADLECLYIFTSEDLRGRPATIAEDFEGQDEWTDPRYDGTPTYGVVVDDTDYPFPRRVPEAMIESIKED